MLTASEFLQQARIAADETERQYRYVLDRVTDGFLFYYFGNVDQVSHMMWRPMDPQHPAYDPAVDPQYRAVVENLYEEMDAIVGPDACRARPRRSPRHHVGPWVRLVAPRLQPEHLAARQRLPDAEAGPQAREAPPPSRTSTGKATRAYGLGLNGLYINLRGRESSGIVDPRARDALVREIGDKLVRTIDPAHRNSRRLPGSSAARRRTRLTGNEDIAPDLIVGYARGTRASDESALGGVPPEAIVDNRSPWSGDHCMDPDAVPGILLTSRPLRRPAAHLRRPCGGHADGARHRRVSLDQQGALTMFGSSIKLDKALLAKAKRYADLAGYSSVEEFITHVLEKEIAHLENGRHRGRNQEAAERARLHFVGPT